VFGGVVVSGSAAVSGAEVSIPRVDAKTSTDSIGRFRLTSVACGRVELQIRKIGFTVYRDTVSLTAGQETARTYTLISVAQLDTVRTTSDEIQYSVPRLQDFEARRKRNVGGHFIAEADLRKLDGVSMPSILRGRMPGLQFTYYRGIQAARGPRPGGAGDDPLMNPADIRSPRGCWMIIYLDGIMMFDGIPRPGSLPPDIGQFMAMSLSGIEYYARASTIPLQFKTTQSNCGTLLFWTRGR
jgi:hypothetical protein